MPWSGPLPCRFPSVETDDGAHAEVLEHVLALGAVEELGRGRIAVGGGQRQPFEEGAVPAADRLSPVAAVYGTGVRGHLGGVVDVGGDLQPEGVAPVVRAVAGAVRGRALRDVP